MLVLRSIPVISMNGYGFEPGGLRTNQTVKRKPDSNGGIGDR